MSQPTVNYSDGLSSEALIEGAYYLVDIKATGNSITVTELKGVMEYIGQTPRDMPCFTPFQVKDNDERDDAFIDDSFYFEGMEETIVVNVQCQMVPVEGAKQA